MSPLLSASKTECTGDNVAAGEDLFDANQKRGPNGLSIGVAKAHDRRAERRAQTSYGRRHRRFTLKLASPLV